MSSAMLLPLATDGVVAVLLVATILFVARLNGRLAVLRQDRDRLAELISGLQLATQQAEEAVRALKLSTAESGHDLQETGDRAAGLRDDLGFLIAKAETLADRLESGLRSRPEAAPVSVRPVVQAASAPAEPRGPSRLASLLRQAQTNEGDRRVEPTPGAAPTAEPEAPALSRSERELQRALLGRR